MHPLHEYIARQIGDKIKDRHVVVMYDERNEYAAFFDEIVAHAELGDLPVSDFDNRRAAVVRYSGSFLEVRYAVEAITGGDSIDDVVIYLPGVRRDEELSLLLELEKLGTHYAQPALQQMARLTLRKRFTDVAIDGLVKNQALSYADFAALASDPGTAEGASILKGIFGQSDTTTLIASWIVDESHDAEIQAKGAVDELQRTVEARLGLRLSDEPALARLRSNVARYVLANEFRLDLTGEAPSSVTSVQATTTDSHEKAVRKIAESLREIKHADAYAKLADQIQGDLGLDERSVSGAGLGSIDTFRFEERAVVRECFRLMASSNAASARTLSDARSHSFWIERDPARKAVWEACRLMLEMDDLARRVEGTISKANGKAEKWVDRYTRDQGEDRGWYRLDQAQRQLETLLAVIDDDDLDEKAVAAIRSAYDRVARKMAEGFIKVYAYAGWTVPGVTHQTAIWSEFVAKQRKPVALVIVDAMRYEIGVELAARLEKLGEVKLVPAISALPSITPVGMAALLPGASSSFSVVEKNGKLGSLIDDNFMHNRESRLQYLQAKVPGIVTANLSEVVAWSSVTKKKITGAQVVVVLSSEIDGAGESTENRYARSIMGGVVADVARALQKLATIGIENAVITADHGHLFFGSEREDSMRLEAPGGEKVELHRRCWIGRGGATPPGSVRVSGAKLGYASDLDVVLPASVSVFKSGGDLAYHHGGASLQELVIPLITIHLKGDGVQKVEKNAVSVKPGFDAVTNRIFSVEIALGGGSGGMFAEARRVRPVAICDGREVAAAKMTSNGAIEDGVVVVEPGKAINVAFLLSDDQVKTLKIQVLDADTDAVLYASPEAIPVRLGV
ncbi:PglZ domain-containing protein [Rhizobium leguminosarum]|uniref:PglZ domain-containing protein n=1 Tax=Rhizobium ruizarguesonis TaxID=2081791 RepID=UPI0013DF260C|nr:PglZ domain-containing protein [Rhizobium ruizarguesonis]NEJ90893.1 PglZ domain-containing protein [Rhizobium ruizarguesonis]